MRSSFQELEEKVVRLFQFDHPEPQLSPKKEMAIKSDRRRGWKEVKQGKMSR